MKVLFKDSEVQKLLDDYQKLVGIRIAVFDTEFNELFASPKPLSPFCKHIRQNKTIHDECKYCDQKAFRQALTKKYTQFIPSLTKAKTEYYKLKQMSMDDIEAVSRTTIFNYLKSEHGMSLTNYINHVRLESSKKKYGMPPIWIKCKMIMQKSA